MGPNNNDSFASWNRQFTMAFGLVGMHPVTDKFIPMMATHWSVQPDQKTIYFKLDPGCAMCSDGKNDHRGRLCLHLEDDAVEVHRRSVLQHLCGGVFRIRRQDRRLHDPHRRQAPELAAALTITSLLPDAEAHDRARRHLGHADEQRAADRDRSLCRLRHEARRVRDLQADPELVGRQEALLHRPVQFRPDHASRDPSRARARLSPAGRTRHDGRAVRARTGTRSIRSRRSPMAGSGGRACSWTRPQASAASR